MHIHTFHSTGMHWRGSIFLHHVWKEHNSTQSHFAISHLDFSSIVDIIKLLTHQNTRRKIRRLIPNSNGPDLILPGYCVLYTARPGVTFGLHRDQRYLHPNQDICILISWILITNSSPWQGTLCISPEQIRIYWGNWVHKWEFFLFKEFSAIEVINP